MKEALIAASIPWLCLFPSISQTSSFSTSAGSPVGQTDKKTERYDASNRYSVLKSLYETHQWFKLRDTVQAAKSPAFYQGAVAYAFNDFKQAEKHLQDVIKSAPSPSRRPRRAGC